MSRIVSVHSYRGGTGKSNLTANLAALVAGHGLRVGIVDTDIQSPGIHVLFGLDESKINRSLNDYLWGRCAVEETACHVTPPPIAARRGTIFLIPSSVKTGEITRILREGYDVGLLSDGFHDLVARLKLDYLFIDTHPGLNEETLLSIALSDVLVLILRPDKQDFQGTAVTVEVARKLNVPKLCLVVNKALPTMNFPSLKEKVEASYHAPVAGILPLTTEMLELASSGLFSQQHPYHPLTRELQKIAETVMA
jgi:MinD-like ATPase involved in chromosome partitioning or flagellar assembly